MDDVKQLQMDLYYFGHVIQPDVAQKMIDSGWKKRFEPTINHNIIRQIDNPIPDMRNSIANQMYGTMDQTR